MTISAVDRSPPNLRNSVALVDLASTFTGAAEMEELTPADVAREFKVSPATVRRWEDKGILKPVRRLPGSHYRRYSRESVEALKAQQAAEQQEKDANGSA